MVAALYNFENLPEKHRGGFYATYGEPELDELRMIAPTIPSDRQVASIYFLPSLFVLFLSNTMDGVGTIVIPSKTHRLQVPL